MTVEINYSDNPEAPLVTDETRRYAQLAWLLRAHTLLDIDCWSVVYGHPLQPGMIHNMILKRLAIPRDSRDTAENEGGTD